METDTPQGTGNWERAPEDQIARRIQAVLEPAEDNQGEDVDEPEAEPVEATEEAPEEEAADAVEAEDTDEAEAEAEEGEPGVPKTVKVKVDGQELDLPLEEVVKGYQRQSDYTRKTQAVAEKDKAREAEHAQALSQYRQVIDQLGSFLDGQQVKAPDPSLAESDPYEYTRQLAMWNDHKGKADAINQERARLQQEHQVHEARRLQEHVAREQEVLLEKVPEWRDKAVRSADQAKLRVFLKEFGVSDQELSDPYSVFQTDHRALLMARLAMKATETSKLKPKVLAKTEGKPKVAKPGTARSKDNLNDFSKAKGRLKKSGSLDDAAAALKHLL